MASLSFDHRAWGASTGEPRRDEQPALKLDDLAAATSLLANDPRISPDAIGCLGICLGASYALLPSAFDPRIRATAFVAGGFNGVASMRAAFGEPGYVAALREHAERRTREDALGDLERMPVVDPDGGEAAMGGREPWEYYGTARSAAPAGAMT